MVESQEKQEIKTNITNAVVFLDGARVTRTSDEISVQKGLNILNLGGISKFLDKDSVRVKGIGLGIKATLVDVEVKYIYKEITGVERLDFLKEELLKLQKERAALDEEKAHFSWIKDKFKGVLENFKVEFPKFLAAGESDIEKLKDIHAYSNDTILDTQKQIFEVDEKIENNALEIDKINREIGKIGGGYRQVEEYYEIIISIEAEDAGNFQLNVDYQIRGGSWTPSFDVQISENKTSITYRAEVVNKTLEDWDDVDLAVSTATFRPVRIIEPQPWFIQERVYRPPPGPPAKMYGGGGGRMKTASRPMTEAKKDEGEVYPQQIAEVKEVTEMKVEKAAFSEDSFGVQHYKIAKKMTIKADGNPHPVLLQEFEVTSSRLFYWNSMDQQVIAQEKIKNGDMQLLPGKVKCFVEGDFVGETGFNKVISPGEEFKLGTRLSYEMKVEKKLVKREVGKTGIMKGKLLNEYSYEIKINNYRNIECDITIIDRIPKSLSPDIIIEPDEKHLKDFFSPEPTKFELSIATFELRLKPEEEFTIEYNYKVNFRKGMIISPPLP